MAKHALITTLLAGFGGQGVLFAGKIMAHAGLIEEQQVSWLPSYGPEMRGGTANCSVCLSDEPISCPLVLSPSVLIAMNLPSYQKFIGDVAPGGMAIMDSTLIEERCPRDDISCFYLPTTSLAEEKGLGGLSGIILLGKALRETCFADLVTVEAAIRKCIPERKQQLAEGNLRALRLGMAL